MEIREKLFYSEDHEWVRVEGDVAYIGVTDFAQEHLGSIVFVELPGIGSEFAAGDTVGAIESVKAVSDMHTPVAGSVVEVNEPLEATPELVNQAPYEQHIAALKMSDQEDLKKLMTSEQYAIYCAKEQE